jgi:type VI secretion system FHA domain protein
MYLTLEVVSSQAAALGAQRVQRVGPNGLTIGRAPDNDWVLPDPYISKQHARIRFEGGQFLVEGLGRNPIAIGRAEHTIPTRTPRALKVGDRLFVDQYELLVVDLEEEPSASDNTERIFTDDAFDDPLPDSGPAALRKAGVAGPSGGARASDRDGGLPQQRDYGQPLESTAPELVPEGWPLSPASSSSQELRRAPTPQAAAAPGRSTSRQAPGPSSTSSPTVPEGRERSDLMPARAPGSPAGRGAAVNRGPAAPARVSPPAGAAGAVAPARAQSMARPAPRAVRSPQDPSSLGGDLVALLQAAGVPERDWSPELAQELGMVLRITVQGVMQMLRARTDIKSQFQLPLTRVQTKENNPLKLCPNVESVLHTLLVQRNPGYLPTVQAFEDAFEDIRNHQAALLAGLRAAFASVLSSFDPQQLRQEFDSTPRRGGFLGLKGSKPRYWQQYVERFEALGTDADETFRRLCGEVFADAYERQLERLKGAEDDEDETM